MNRILCSSGAVIGKANDNNYRLLPDFFQKLNCDGYELLLSSSWYSDLDRIVREIKSYGLVIPVIHSQKSLGESLCGMTTTYADGKFTDYVMTPEEDEAAYKDGTERFLLNLKVAAVLGAEKIVLHLWNGTVSDKNINRNVDRFGKWKEMAEKEGISLLVENVICNTHDPLYNVGLVAKKYDDAGFVYDTKMAEFHCQTMKLFDEYEWIVKAGRIKHLHVNDYSGGYMDWGNMRVLPIGEGHVDFDSFFAKLGSYGYEGDYTIEATSISKDGTVDFDKLNQSFEHLRKLRDKYIDK